MSKPSALDLVRPIAVGIGIFGATAAIGAAQMTNPCPTSAPAPGPITWNAFDPAYNNVDAWQSAWDTGAYDRNHVLLGTVGKYARSRLTVNSPQGDSMVVDLKEGTVIRPTGATPTAGQRVAVFGYWSNGTFIANRVILRG
jgi:hypothetical protein